MNVKLLVIRPNLAQFHVVEFFQVYLDGVTRWLDYLWNNWTFSIMKICPIWKNYAIEGSKFCPILPKQILKNCQIPLRFCQSAKSSGHTVHKQRESSQRYGTIMVMPNICSHPPLTQTQSTYWDEFHQTDIHSPRYYLYLNHKKTLAKSLFTLNPL